MTDNRLKFGHIHDVYIAFEDDPSQGKSRPILMIKEKQGLYSVMQITTAEPTTDFQHATRYKIIEWNKAGLTRQSYIKLYPKDYRHIAESDITNYRGKLTDLDINGFSKKVIETQQFLKDNPRYLQ